MKHIVTFLDGSTKEYTEESASDIIASTGEYPKLASLPGMFNVQFSDGRHVYFPFEAIKYVVTLPQEGDEAP